MRKQFINLRPGEGEKAIYRIISCKRFLQILNHKENGLVLPRLWNDPFENFMLKGIAVFPDGTKTRLWYRDHLYGQCWSLHREADLMWRAYSPNGKAVKVQTTIRRLYDSLYQTAGESRAESCFIGKVQYFQKKRIAEILERPDLLAENVNIAATVLVKRWAFLPEKEVRLIYMSHDFRFSSDVFRYKLDPNSVFLEAVLDPRMQDAEANKWKERIQGAGFRNKIIQSGLYKPPKQVVIKLPQAF